MFTGIVTDVGQVKALLKKPDGDLRVEIRSQWDLSGVAIGASVCCSGACLTVVEKGPDWLAFEVSQETLDRTSMGQWAEGSPVNLERSLRVGDEMGGHIVTGHVDGLAEIISATPDQGSLRLKLRVPQTLARFIAAKGSVTLDGVSLTVNEVEGDVFGVNIIAHTQFATTLGAARPGQKLNLEIDIMARYVARLADTVGLASMER